MRLFVVIASIGLFLSLAACTPGNIVPEHNLKEGNQAIIDDMRDGEPVVLTFWASWCSFCKEELPIISQAAAKTSHVSFIGVNLQESPATVANYWINGDFNFPTLLDESAELKAQYDVFTQPTTFFLNANGEVIDRKNGPLGEAELEQKLVTLVASTAPPPPKVIELIDTNPPPTNQPDIEATPPTEIEDLPNPFTDLKEASNATSPTPNFLNQWYSPRNITDRVAHTIPLDEVLSGGPLKDGIPSIDSPKFIKINEADYLNNEDVGILLTVGNDTRFYPYAILNRHEIVNDTVGGKRVAVTYCPLCATGVVFDSNISAGKVEFGVSGFLYQSNLLMYDRATESLWNQATGTAVVGKLTGEKLTWVQSDIMRFSAVINLHPDAKVLSTATGFGRNYVGSPYGNYAQNRDIYFDVQATDDRLHEKELVHGIVVNGVAKAYRLSDLQSKQKITDTVGGDKIELVYKNDSVRAIALTKNKEIVTLPIFWFAWVAQYPKTELFK